jgi:flagellar hook-associated protein 2
MGLTPLAFTGISKFSNDFQTILGRTVAIAQLPVQALQRDQLTLSQRTMSLAKLREAAMEFAAAAKALGAQAETRAMDVWSSSSKVGASLTGGAAPATFVITDITALARSAVSTSTSGYATTNATEVAGAGDYLELVVGGQAADLDLSGGKDSLEGVRDAINAAGLGVSASILNTGSETDPYVLTISANDTGYKPISLRTVKGSSDSNLLTTVDSGADASFRLNGQTVTASTNTIEDVVEGVSFTLQNTTDAGESITVTVRSSPAALITAINRFVKAYNALATKLQEQIGESAGALSGSSIVGDFMRLMRRTAGFTGEGSVRSISELGLTFTKEGVLEFDSSVINAMDATRLEDAFGLIGSSTTGFGELGAQLEDYTDPVIGVIQREIESNNDADSRLSDQIEAMNERIEIMRSSLMAKLQAADALLAQLESQQGMLDATIESLKLVSYGKNRED